VGAILALTICCAAAAWGSVWLGQKIGWLWVVLLFIVVAGIGYLIFRAIFQNSKQNQEGDGDLFIPGELLDDLNKAYAEEDIYLQTSQSASLDAAIAIWERIFEHPSFTQAPIRTRSALINDAGSVFIRCYWHNGRLPDLERAIQLWQQAVQLTPPDSPDRPMYLSNLGNGLNDRYIHTGSMADLDEAIRITQEAVQLTSEDSPERPGYLTSLGNGLKDRYSCTGAVEDLAEAIRVTHEAVQLTPSDSPDRPARLANLGVKLHDRYKLFGASEDLEEAIRLWVEAVQLTPPDSPNQPALLNNLSNGLSDRYKRTGAMEDLEETIRVTEQAVHLTPPDSPDRPARLNNLGDGLAERYNRTGALSDLEESIRLSREAVQLVHPHSLDWSAAATNLGTMLYARYIRTGAPADLEEATSVSQEAAALIPPDSPRRATHLNNLSNLLSERYIQTGALSDLEETIRYVQEAVDLTPIASPNRPAYLNNLGSSLSERYNATAAIPDLEEAIRVLREAVALTTPGSSDRPNYLNSLGTALRDRYRHTKSLTDLEEAIGIYQEAAQSGMLVAPNHGLIAARNWGNWALERQSWSEASQAYALGLQAVELLFTTQFDRPSKEAWLKEFHGMPANTAYALARLGQLDQALAAIESGRARLLSEALKRSRRNLERLVDVGHADLLKRYRDTSARFDALTRPTSPIDTPDETLTARPADLLQQIQTARVEMDATIAEIRGVPGYEDFLLSLPAGRIQALAAEASLVYLAATPSGGLALVVGQHKVQAVWLDFNEVDLEALLVHRQDGAVTGGYLLGQIGDPDWLIASLKESLPILGERVVGPVAACLRSLGTRSVTLIPTGRLATLPLHAASYVVNGRSTHFLDEFDVAYAQSAQALAAAQAQAKERQVHTATLAGVGNPLPTPQPLPFAQAELEEIATFFGAHARPLYNEQASKAAFLQALSGATHVHLSCHGSFNPQEPLSSALYFAGQEPLTLSEVLDGQVFSQARLVVLSACQTAITDFSKIPDEAIGLPGGFLQAGIPGVVGTLWSVNDKTTALIMVKFYEFALRDGLPYPQALCAAQRWLRDATAGELLAYFKQHKSLRYGQFRQGKQFDNYPDDSPDEDDMLRFELQDPQAQPFHDKPYHWAPFVFYGA